jgi:hypothetical protein
MARDLPLGLIDLPAMPAPGQAAGLVRWRRENGDYRVAGWRLGPFQVGDGPGPN